MDVHTGVAALQAKHLDTPTGAGARRPERDLAARRGGHSAGAADAQRALLFVVEVQKIAGLEYSTLKFRSAGQTGLFIDGETELQRTVSNIRALHYRQGSRHPHTVVGAQSGSVGLQPVAIAHDLDGVGVKAVSYTHLTLADHVEVALQQGCLL